MVGDSWSQVKRLSSNREEIGAVCKGQKSKPISTSDRDLGDWKCSGEGGETIRVCSRPREQEKQKNCRATLQRLPEGCVCYWPDERGTCRVSSTSCISTIPWWSYYYPDGQTWVSFFLFFISFLLALCTYDRQFAQDNKVLAQQCQIISQRLVFELSIR